MAVELLVTSTTAGGLSVQQTPPNTSRQGVIGGFAMGASDFSTLIVETGNGPVYVLVTIDGLGVALGAGICLANGNLFIYDETNAVLAAYAIPNPPASTVSWLWYGTALVSGSHFYWTSSPAAPHVSDDALLGWAATNATVLIATSTQNVVIPTISLSEVYQDIGLPTGLPVVPGGAYGDTAVPGAPSFPGITGLPFNVNTPPYTGALIVGPLVTWAGYPLQLQSISIVTFYVYYVNGWTPVDAGLTAAVNATVTSFPVANGLLYTVGNAYWIDEEIVFVTATAAHAITVERGVFGSIAKPHFGPMAITAAANSSSLFWTYGPIAITAAGHGRTPLGGNVLVGVSGVLGNTAANGGWSAYVLDANTLVLLGSTSNGAYTSGGTLAASQLYQISLLPVKVPFDPSFWTSLAAPNWFYTILLPGAYICAVLAWGTNALGQGATGYGEVGGETYGFGTITFNVNGTLGIASNAAQPVQASGVFNQAWATCETAPAGAAITVQITVNGVVWGTVFIPEGLTAGPAISAFALGPIPAAARGGLNVIGVGTTFPGAGLTVVVQ